MNLNEVTSKNIKNASFNFFQVCKPKNTFSVIF